LAPNHLCAFVRHCLPFGGAFEEIDAEMGRVVGSFGRIVAKAEGANFSLQRTDNFGRGRGVILNFTATDPINAFERWRVSAVNTDTRTRRVPAPFVPH
jgi:hypothetical protein